MIKHDLAVILSAILNLDNLYSWAIKQKYCRQWTVHPYISNIRGFELNFRPFIKIIILYSNLLAAILKMVNLTMSGQYFSLETVISEMNAKFPTRMMLSPNSTRDVRMGSSLPEWSLD